MPIPIFFFFLKQNRKLNIFYFFFFLISTPATKWGQGEWEPDLFDCRLRPWYLQGAASAKDMIILVDTSGSMTGVRKEIAKHVVLTLLDTLSENDFINIYKFSEVPVPVVPCFKDKIVQVRGQSFLFSKQNQRQCVIMPYCFFLLQKKKKGKFGECEGVA